MASRDRSPQFSKLFRNYYCCYSLRVFHITVSWCSFTGVWATASTLKSPGLFSVFWSISVMQLFGWFSLILFFLSKSSSPFINPLVTVLIIIGINVTFMLHSFSALKIGQGIYPSFRFFWFYSVVSQDSKFNNFACSLFFFVDYYKVWSFLQD